MRVFAAAVSALLLSAPALGQADDLHQALVRQSIALERAAEGSAAAPDVQRTLAGAESVLEPLRTPPAGLDPVLAQKAYHLRGLLAAVRARQAAGTAAAPPALPPARTLLGADAPGASCASAIPLSEGDALRLPVAAGARVWLRVAGDGKAPLSLTTRGSTLDPALAAFVDCRVAGAEPFARADDSFGLQAELALLPKKQTFWYVRADNLSGAGDLVLSALRAVAISGRVTRSVSGTALPGVRVVLFRNEGSYYSTLTSVVTDATGAYALAVAGSGTYALRTGDDTTQGLGVIHQAYDGFRCTGGYYYDLYYCGTQGNQFTPIVLTDPSERTIDFALEVGGAAAGQLTSSLGGPVAGAQVIAHTTNGYELRSTTSDALGRWRMDGLPNTGIYLTAGAYDHARTLHAGIECQGTSYFNCNFAAGTLVTVPLESQVRVDMTLRRQQFIQVDFTLNGSPLVISPYGYGVDAALLNANGAVVAQGAFVGGSRYRIGPLSPGSYRLRATSAFSYPRLYPAADCASDCIAELGFGEVITVAATDTVIERNMDLRRYPSISGRVTTQEDGSPVASAVVTLSPVSGNFYGGYTASTSSDGGYRFDAVAPGSYLLRFASDRHVDEVHDNLPCNSTNPALDCPGATLIGVGSSTPDRTIDAALARSATISGRVTGGGQMYQGYGSFNLVRPDGSVAASWSGYTSSVDGRYTLQDVPSGTWRIAYYSDPYYGFQSQLHAGVDCAAVAYGPSFAACPLAQATPVVVQNGSVITDIDFNLRRSGSHVVRMLNAFDDTPLAGVMIDVWNAGGQRVDSRATDASGRAYPVGGPGTTLASYALSTDNDQGLVNEVYQDITCPNGSVFFGSCALAGYTPVLFPAPAGSPEIVWRIARPVPIFGGNFE
jgi:hypothetical protein